MLPILHKVIMIYILPPFDFVKSIKKYTVIRKFPFQKSSLLGSDCHQSIHFYYLNTSHAGKISSSVNAPFKYVRNVLNASVGIGRFFKMFGRSLTPLSAEPSCLWSWQFFGWWVRAKYICFRFVVYITVTRCGIFQNMNEHSDFKSGECYWSTSGSDDVFDNGDIFFVWYIIDIQLRFEKIRDTITTYTHTHT